MPKLWSSGMREGGAGSQAATAGAPEGGAEAQEGGDKVLHAAQLLRSCSVVIVHWAWQKDRHEVEGRGRCKLGL